MKNLARITCGCLSAAMLLTTVAAGPVTTQAAAAKLSKTSATLEVGKKLTLKVQNAKKGAKVKWSSNKKTVAAVSQKGVVTAKAAGKATIKAVVDKNTLKCNVTVKEQAAPNVDAADITAQLAGKSYKGTVSIPGITMEVLNLSFGDDGAVSGAKLNETTFELEDFSGTYKAVLTGKTVNITVDANGNAFSYELTVESDDFSKLSAVQKVGSTEVTVTIEEVKA